MPIIGHQNHSDTISTISPGNADTALADALLLKDPRTDQMATVSTTVVGAINLAVNITWLMPVSISSLAVLQHTFPASTEIDYRLYSPSIGGGNLVDQSGFISPGVADYSAASPDPRPYNQSMYTFTQFVDSRKVPKVYDNIFGVQIVFKVIGPMSANIGYLWIGADYNIEEPIEGARQSKRLATVPKGIPTFNNGVSAVDSENVKHLTFSMAKLTAYESNVMEAALDYAGTSRPVFFRPNLLSTPPKDPTHEGGVVRFVQEFTTESVDVRKGTEEDLYRIPSITLAPWR